MHAYSKRITTADKNLLQQRIEFRYSNFSNKLSAEPNVHVSYRGYVQCSIFHWQEQRKFNFPNLKLKYALKMRSKSNLHK